MDAPIASYPQLQLIQQLHRNSRSLLMSPPTTWRAVGAPAHGTIGTYADLAANATLPSAAALAQRVGGRTDPLFNPQHTSNVYINGLPTFFSTSQLYDLCSEFGPITSVRTFDRLNTPEPSTYGFVLFADIDSARRCIVSLRQYSDLHPSFAKTQKIPQPSTDSQLSDAFEKRMERLSLFDSSNRFLAANTPQSVVSRTSDADDMWRARVASAPVLQAPARSKFSGARSSLETVLEDPNALPQAPADVFVQGLPLHLQDVELEALFSPHKILDSRVCQVHGAGGLPDSISGVMRLGSLSAAREVQNKLNGFHFPGWSYSLNLTVIDNHNDDNAFEVQPGRAPAAGQHPVGLGVPSIRSAAQAFSGRRAVSTPTGSSAGMMASIHAPRDVGAPRPRAVSDREPGPIYATGRGAVGSERSSPIGSERHMVPLELDAAFSPRSRSGSGSDGSMSPVSPALTFTSAGRTPTMATIATPRHDDESKNMRGEHAQESGLDLKLGHVGEVALTVGLAGLDD